MAEEYVSKASVLAALEWRWAGKGAIDAVKAIPPAEVVPVVRCHECVHKEYCCRTIRSDGRKDEDYCSYGEKDGEQA